MTSDIFRIPPTASKANAADYVEKSKEETCGKEGI